MANNLPEPKSREESYLAKAAGMDTSIPATPESRKEQYLAAIAEGGGGGGGSYTAGDGIDITNDVISTTNTGKPKVLTTADYNYPADNPTTVALWLLPEGFYAQGTDVKVRVNISTSFGSINGGYFLVGIKDAYGRAHITSFNGGDAYYYVTNYSTGASVLTRKLDTVVVQTTGTNTENVMSQNATTNMFYKTPNSGLSSIGIGYNTVANIGSATEGNIVIGNNINTVSTNRNVMVGESTQGATTGYCGTAIGTSAHATATCSVALGSYATANTQGQLDVSTGSQTTSGYNNSRYRLITGVYDGQSLHDAATVAQGNTLSTAAPTTATAGVLGQLYTDTTNMHTYQLGSIDTTDPSNPVYNWIQRW